MTKDHAAFIYLKLVIGFRGEPTQPCWPKKKSAFVLCFEKEFGWNHNGKCQNSIKRPYFFGETTFSCPDSYKQSTLKYWLVGEFNGEFQSQTSKIGHTKIKLNQEPQNFTLTPPVPCWPAQSRVPQFQGSITGLFEGGHMDLWKTRCKKTKKAQKNLNSIMNILEVWVMTGCYLFRCYRHFPNHLEKANQHVGGPQKPKSLCGKANWKVQK